MPLNSFDFYTLCGGGKNVYKIYLPQARTDYIQKEIAMNGVPYEHIMLQDILKRINPAESFVDIGSNIGNHSLFLAANGIKVYSFEANKELCQIETKSIESNGFESLIKVFCCGLSDREELASFETINESNLGGNSLTLGKGEIVCKRLDDFAFEEKIGVIKIDVEGMEEKVLLGARETIAKNRPLIYAEAINQNAYLSIDEVLDSLGYIYYKTFNATPTHLYVPQENISEKEMLKIMLSKNAFNNYRITQSLNYHKNSKAKHELLAKQLQDLQEMVNRLGNWQEAINQLKQENNQLKLQLKNEKLIYEQKNNQIKNTLSWMWGNRIVTAKSFKKIITLPYYFYKDYQKFQQKIGSKFVPLTPLYRKDIDLEKTLKRFHKIISNPKQVKVACIMDNFTYECFRFECDLLQLSPFTWKEEIESFKPDLLFIESAWEGKDSAWKLKISSPSLELANLLSYCQSQNIPTIFWNKEDPVSFKIFLYLAQKVDFIFTTDIDCVSRYKYYAGHTNVYCLPFAAQPQLHNPIEAFKRKDAFNFAGSYYAKYPTRIQNFKTIIDIARKFKPVTIYDRNYGRNMVSYLFPEEYKPMILGRLEPADIAQAYKGYHYGITLNTVKQSQSMFARRAYELIACNTLVISNFSSGIVNLLGDLVVSTDNAIMLEKTLRKILENPTYTKKLKLLALRKVMSEDTYTHRFYTILQTVFDEVILPQEPMVYWYVEAHSKEELESAIIVFNRQQLSHKTLVVYQNFEGEMASAPNLIIKTSLDAILQYFSTIESGFFGILNLADYYGEFYLYDLMLARRYSNASAFGKSSFYVYEKGEVVFHKGLEYQEIQELQIDSSICALQDLDRNILKSFIVGDSYCYAMPAMLALDCFHYCKNGASAEEVKLEVVQDIKNIDAGLSLGSLRYFASQTPAVIQVLNSKVYFKLTSNEIFEQIGQDSSTKIQIRNIPENGILSISSSLRSGEHKYIYMDTFFPKESLNLHNSNQCLLDCDFDVENLQVLVEFYDENKQKISHSLNPSNQAVFLAVPTTCQFVKLGLRVLGGGIISIRNLYFDNVHLEPYARIPKSKVLVVAKRYPSYDNLYEYGFLHQRLLAYKQQGFQVDLMTYSSSKPYECREFEGISVVNGSLELLKNTLESGAYTCVAVHLLDRGLWDILSKFLDKLKIIIWIHGSEIQTLERRMFNMEGKSQEEIQRAQKLSDNRVKLWQSIFKNLHPNLHFVFVSEHFKNECLGDIGVDLPKDSYSIIHNPINTTLFNYIPKNAESRKKILSIRPFASKKYANDLSVKAILELSKKSFFKDLEFLISGDGELFEKTLKPLRGFKNITIQQKFLQQEEIAKLHKDYGIFLNPSRMDSQGVSRDEAMSSGLVPITNKVAAIPEFVDGNCGILVEAEDYMGLANAIEFLYKNPQDFLRLSENAAKRVRKQSDVRRIISKEIEVLNGE
ncbi:FkbM family methyltransferase [Helicobacter sp.]|uniref:FkbM family methyltransferase n=1 Tax=Helicobacter sp. TaxID=218 RepID=UPI001989C3EF|nr:FkbM family methyltransferase [Helicobacter sp.]MBD5164983.1 FkbM family methyltransferase [Helicobacter sp.]